MALSLIRQGVPLPRGGVIDFSQRYFDASPGNLLALYVLNDAGATIADTSGNSFDGTYTSVTVQGATGPDGQLTAVWDGINDYGDIFSAPLAAAYNGAQLTLSIWFQVANTGVWTDGAARTLWSMGQDGNNRSRIEKRTVNNTVQWLREGNNITDSVSDAGFSGSLAWHQATFTVNESGDVLRAILDGAQTGIDQGGLGAYAGSIVATLANIGARTTAPVNVMSGALAYAALYDVALTVPQAQSLYWIPVA